MLRLPNDHLWLGLGPRQVGAARCAGRRRQGEAIGSVAMAAAPDATGALLQALEQLLDTHALRRRTVHTVLSDRLVRYALVPFSATYLNADEERALCQARFSALYGPMPDWYIVIEPARYGRTRVACAMPAALAAGLDTVFNERALGRGAIVPHFVARWNHRPAALRGRSGMLAVAESDTLVLASFDRTGWRSLRALYADTAGSAVADLVYRERLLHGIDPATPLWHTGTVPCHVEGRGADEADDGIALALAGMRA